MINKKELLKYMDLAIKQDRERFFRTTDSLHLQPKYQDKLDELEILKQQWRDITDIEDYPNITFPLQLPNWFPKIYFASFFEKNVFIENNLQ